MRTYFLLALLTLSLPIALALAQHSTSGSALQAMIETERAFSKASEAKGTRDAFMAFIADDGILFRPEAVNGKQWMLEHPLPPSEKRPLLSWQPEFAFMSAAGDLGYTSGPWQYKDDIKDEKPSAYGDFVTVWKRQTDGTWKFAVDLGISHPRPARPQVLLQVESKVSAKQDSTVDVDDARKALAKRDSEFSDSSLKQGFAKAFASYAAPDVRLYRDGSLPFVGKPAVAQALDGKKQVLKWQPKSGDVSRSGDLGYTYGVYEASDPTTSKVTERGNYLRIWRKQGGAWRVVLDVASPMPG